MIPNKDSIIELGALIQKVTSLVFLRALGHGRLKDPNADSTFEGQSLGQALMTHVFWPQLEMGPLCLCVQKQLPSLWGGRAKQHP